MKKKLICILLFMLIMTGCSKEKSAENHEKTKEKETAEIAEPSKKHSETDTTNTEEFTTEEIMENAPEQDKDGMPYMSNDVESTIYKDYKPKLDNPWNRFDFLDNVTLLKAADMKGDKTFLAGAVLEDKEGHKTNFDGDVYAFIDKEGRKKRAATLPVGDNKPDIVHLYMSKTKATENLKKGDVIALEATFNYPAGAMVKVIQADITGDVVHLATICPRPEEMWKTQPSEKAK